MSKSKQLSIPLASPCGRRQFTKEFKEQAVQMLLGGHSAASIVERLGAFRNEPLVPLATRTDRPVGQDGGSSR